MLPNLRVQCWFRHNVSLSRDIVAAAVSDQKLPEMQVAEKFQPFIDVVMELIEPSPTEASVVLFSWVRDLVGTP